MNDFRAFAARYMPNLDLNNAAALPGYNNAYMIEQVLKNCGDDLTRENLLKEATSLKGLAPPMFIDGIGVYNSPTDYRGRRGQHCKRKLFSIEGRSKQRDLARTGAKPQKKTLYNQRLDGGRSRIRTADPLGVNEML